MLLTDANDTKICDVMDSAEYSPRLDQDLDQMGKYTKELQIEFNTDKCNALHFDNLN